MLAASTSKHFDIYPLVVLIYLAISHPATWSAQWVEAVFKVGRSTATSDPMPLPGKPI